MKSSIAHAAGVAALIISNVAGAQITSPPPVDLEKVQQIVGDWSYGAIAGGSQATLVDTSGNARLILRCTRASRLVTIMRLALPAAVPAIVVTTSFGSRSLPASYDSNHNLSVSVPAADPLLDDIAFSRGRFAIGNSGSAALVVPAWGEVTRVIEDCRN